MITINIAKAKDITKDRLRVDRKPLLEAQDVLFMKAQELGSDTTAIVAEKERDLFGRTMFSATLKVFFDEVNFEIGTPAI